MTAGKAGIDQVKEAVAAALGIDPDELTESSSEDDIDEWDSAGIINLVMTLESEFGVSFAEEEAQELRSMAQVIALLREKGLVVG